MKYRDIERLKAKAEELERKINILQKKIQLSNNERRVVEYIQGCGKVYLN